MRSAEGLLPAMVEEIEVEPQEVRNRVTITEIGEMSIEIAFTQKHFDEFGIIFRNELKRSLSK